MNENRDKFLLDEYKSLRDEITRAANHYESVIRYSIIFIAASFAFIVELTKNPTRHDVIFFTYLGINLILYWMTKIALLLDNSTVKIGMFIKRIENVFLENDANILGWQTFYARNSKTFNRERSKQRFLIKIPGMIYFIFLSLYLYSDIIKRYTTVLLSFIQKLSQDICSIELTVCLLTI